MQKLTILNLILFCCLVLTSCGQKPTNIGSSKTPDNPNNINNTEPSAVQTSNNDLYRGDDQIVSPGYESFIRLDYEGATYNLTNLAFSPVSLFVGMGKDDHSYTMILTAHSKNDDSEFKLKFVSNEGRLSELTPGEYFLEFEDMEEKDLYWGISFSPNMDEFFEMETGALALYEVRMNPKVGYIKMNGKFNGTAKCFDLNSQKVKNEGAFKGEFDIYINHGIDKEAFEAAI